jgi:hypothetical protein
MPKDPIRNIDRYKVRGGRLNEFDFTRQKQTMQKYGESAPVAKKKKPRGTRGARRKNR